MFVTIYQLREDNMEAARLMFLNYTDTVKELGTNVLRRDLYDRVFIGDTDCRTLGELYVMFNSAAKTPEWYRGRSMSVSDVIEVMDSTTTAPGFYFVDGIGFERIVWG